MMLRLSDRFFFGFRWLYYIWLWWWCEVRDLIVLYLFGQLIVQTWRLSRVTFLCLRRTSERKLHTVSWVKISIFRFKNESINRVVFIRTINCAKTWRLIVQRSYMWKKIFRAKTAYILSKKIWLSFQKLMNQSIVLYLFGQLIGC